MRMLEIFSGTGRMAQAFRKQGWTARTVDRSFEADLNIDAKLLTREGIIELMGGGVPDFIWFSPPCTAFSVASISRHWRKVDDDYYPQTEAATEGLVLLQTCFKIIEMFPDVKWAIENPRGMMRKMPEVQGSPRHTVTYCQYGESRMKPTDIWSNLDWTPRPHCRNGDPCHEAAPRGSKTGTQGIKGAYLRGALPFEFCDEIAGILAHKYV